MRRLFKYGLFLLVSLGSSAMAEDLAPSAATESLVKHLSAMKSMQAGFHQWVYDGRQSILQEVQGTLWIKRPGLFRWDANDPYPQQIVSDGTVLWIYDRDLDQVTKRKLDRQVGNTPALLLSGDPAELSRSFDISAHGTDNGDIGYDLKPKGQEALFELLRVHFSGGRITEMYLKDNLGQTTRIEFAIKSLNQALPDKQFEFVPPKGADVITDL